MLHILLFILKLCGILLLSVIGIFLFVVICILFVPINYRLKIKKQDITSIQLCTTWLFHIFCLDYLIQKKKDEEAWKNSFCFRFFGVPIETDKKTEKLKKKVTKRKKKKQNKKVSQEKKKQKQKKISEEKNNEKKSKEQQTEKTARKQQPKIEQKPKKENSTRENQKEKWKKENSEEKTKKREKENQESRIAKFLKNIKKIKDKKEQLFEFWNREEHRLARKSIYKIFHFLWKKSKPKKIKGNIRFGFEDPCTTGLVLGFLSILQSQYKNEFILEANFEKEILEAEVELRGRISVYHFIYSFFRIYRDKNIRTMYHNWNK